jgi:hypothetical protein
LHRKRHKVLRAIPMLILLANTIVSYGQTGETVPSWDNQLYIGNKIAAGKDDWRFSGELQVRLKNNTQNLDNYFVQGIATYKFSKRWEIAPDFRLSIKQDEMEYRLGLSIVNKVLGVNLQLVNQVKWQVDFDTRGDYSNAMWYVAFLNYRLNDHLLPNLVAGGFYRWKYKYVPAKYFNF